MSSITTSFPGQLACSRPWRALSADSDRLLFLQSLGDAWGLVTREGTVVYRADGPDARRSCLRTARELDILALR
jgi:hypothetical protein